MTGIFKLKAQSESVSLNSLYFIYDTFVDENHFNWTIICFWNTLCDISHADESERMTWAWYRWRCQQQRVRKQEVY